MRALFLRLFRTAWIVAAAYPACDGARPASAAEAPLFSRDVWPVLRERCWSCHSGDKAEGKLRFDAEEHLRRGGENGPVVVAGKPEASSLLEQVSGKEPAMPPEGSPLSAEQVDVLRRWIAAGAKIDAMPVDRGTTVHIPTEYEFAPAITSVAVHPGGKLAACACRSEVVLVPLEAAAKSSAGAMRRLPTEADLLTHVEFSPDGRVLAAAGGTPARFGEVRFFDVATGKLLAARRASDDTLFRGSFAPDGRTIALGAADGAVYLVPVDAKQPIRRAELHSDWLVDVAWTPDGTKLITVGRDKTTKVASAEDGRLLRNIDTSVERVNAVAADDTLAVSGGAARTLSGYKLAAALENVELSGSGNGARPVSRLAQYLQAFPAQSNEIVDLALSGDRRTLAVGIRTGEVRLYTLADRKPLAVVNSASPLYGLALDADGKQLFVGTKAGLLAVYELPSGKKLREIEPVPVKKTVAAASR